LQHALASPDQGKARVSSCVSRIMARYKQSYTLQKRVFRHVKVYYYQTYDDAGRRTVARSTGCTTIGAARAHCDNLLAQGKLAPEAVRSFKEYAAEWWQWDKCRYVAMMRRRGPNAITREHVANRRGLLVTHLSPFFDNTALARITREDVERWQAGLVKKGLSSSTANNALACLRTMMREAVARKLIHREPTLGIRALPSSSKGRHALTVDEVRALLGPAALTTAWAGDVLHYTINMAAAFTGCRLGELLALRSSSILPGHLLIDSSMGRVTGLKPTKTRRDRVVPIPAGLEEALRRLAPAEGRVFRIGGQAVNLAFKRALGKLGMQDEERRSRGITFHGWRHFYNSYLRGHGVPDPLVRRSTGHQTAQMTENYTSFNREDYKPILVAMEALQTTIQKSPKAEK
jgi:integrase